MAGLQRTCVVLLLFVLHISNPPQNLGQENPASVRKLDELRQKNKKRMDFVVTMFQLSRTLSSDALQMEARVAEDQVADLRAIVDEFQKSQIAFTIKSGDRYQVVKSLIGEGRSDEALALSKELYAEMDARLLQIRGRIKRVLHPKQWERLEAMGKRRLGFKASPPM